MPKFTIIPGRHLHSGLTDIQHNESPRCRLLVSDLNINDAYEGDGEDPVKIFDRTDPEDGYTYWAEITLLDRQESGNYDKVVEDCWRWWLALQIRKRELEDLEED